MALVPSQETPLQMPAYMLEPAMEAYYQEEAYSESTMLCSEAYILIAQQNFKDTVRHFGELSERASPGKPSLHFIRKDLAVLIQAMATPNPEAES
ncbi:hypothetical protein CEP52_008617 [Fusarium oligoseptatum]|uniref:Uncharacterized protein n=1 Tax=Fusarium oligoseptatum TaxID=2604345 RepID=A0A428TH56_9HYPO|nr:hypothetical protein CEP52_008617 [Fusarium oligoseptatum]